MTTKNKKFSSYVCPGDYVETHKGPFTLRATVLRDIDSHIDDDDCHNQDQSVTGADDKTFARILQARKAWENGEWFYCGLIVSVWLDGEEIEDNVDSLWGLEANYPESDNSHLSDVADDLFDGVDVEAIRDEQIAKHQARIAALSA